MPSFFSRFNSSKSGKDRNTTPSSSSTRPVTGSGSRSDDKPANLLPLELPSSSLLADTSRANPHFLSTPVRQLSFHSAHKPVDDRGEQSDLRSLRSSEGGGSPWVAVDAENTPRTIRKGSTTGGAGSAKVGFPELADPERERREQARLERARLTVEDVTLLSEECGDVIRSRGLTSLGLFRPYRASESPAQIRKLALLFLDYVAEFDERAAATTNEASPSRGTDASKSVLLHAYRQELRFANVHDVVAVLKWGLRHIDFGRLTFSSARAPSLEWYSSFVRRSSSASPPHPPHAFSQFLLPSLPPPLQKLLLSLLHTIQPVAAHAQQNAMPAHRLCYLLGAYVFGLAAPAPPSSTSSSAGTNRVKWEDYSRSWSEAGRALEGCLKAYLREQTDLPPRLQELIEDYSTWISDDGIDASSRHVRTIKALKLEVESVGEWESAGSVRSNSQSTGLGTDGKTGRPARRRPVEILAAAIGAELPVGQHDDDEAEARAWNALSRLLQAADYSQEPSLAPFDEETVRVLELLNLDRSTADLARETGTTPSRRSATSSHRRTRSSVDPADLPSPTRPLTAFLSPSPSMPAISPLGKLRSSPSWHDFSTQGFTQSSLDLSSDLYDPSKNRVAPAPRMYKPAPPTSRITSISVVDVEEDFIAVWLDSLSESATTSSPAASLPSILLSPLSPAAQSEVGDSSSRIAALLIVEALLTRPRPTETLDSPPRIASLQPPTTHVTVDRRASFLGVRRGRKSEGAPPSSSTSPPSSPSKNWRRRASALFAPPMLSRNQSNEEVPSVTSTAHGTVSLDSSPRARTAVPSVHARRPSTGRMPSDPPVDVFGTAIMLPPPPPLPPKDRTPSEKIPTPPEVEEVEGYVVEEPGLATLHEPAHEPEEVVPAERETEEVSKVDSEAMQPLDTSTNAHLLRNSEPGGQAEVNDEPEEASESDHLAPALDGDTSIAAAAEPESDARMERDHTVVMHESPDRHVSVPDVAEPQSLPAPPANDLVTDGGLVPSERSDDAMLNAAEQGKAESANRDLTQEAHDAHGNGDASMSEDAEARRSESKLLAPAIPLALSEELPAEPAVTTDDSVQLSDSAASETVYNSESSPASAEVPSVETASLASPGPVSRAGPPSTPSPRRRVPTPIVTPRRSLESNGSPSPLASPPPRSPRHPARAPISPDRRSSTPGSRSALHNASVSSLETEAEEIKQLRKVEEEAKRKIVKEQKTPKLVSNVKERVREIEEEAIGSPTAAGGPAGDPTSPIRSSSPKQQPFTPNRSSFLQASPTSSARGPPPILAPPIVAGSPTSLAPAALPMSLLVSEIEHSFDGDANVAEPAVFESVVGGVPSSPNVGRNLTGEAPSATSEPETPAEHAYQHTVSNVVDAGSEPIASNVSSTASPPQVPPTQESEHLHVKVPTSLAELPSPIPSPSPSPSSFVAEAEGEAAPLVEDVPVIQDSLRAITSNPGPESDPFADHEHTASDLVDAGPDIIVPNAAGTASPPRLPPTQECEHLHVKVPTSLAELPSPIPSPSPSPSSFVAEAEGEAAPLVEDVSVVQDDLRPITSNPEPEPEPPADHEHTASDLVDAGPEHIFPDAAVAASPPQVPPPQESEHLHVEVPTSLAELPSPIPSPSPFPVKGEYQGAAVPLLVKDEPVVQDEPLPTTALVPEPPQDCDVLPDSRPDAAQPEQTIEEVVAGGVTPADDLPASSTDEPIERPATPPPHPLTQNETPTPTHPNVARPPIHVLHISPSKQSLATTAASSYQTATEGGSEATSVAGSGSGSSDHEPAL